MYLTRDPAELRFGQWVSLRSTHPTNRCGVYRVTTTAVPTPTCPNRSRMSWLYMRMQPCETKPPTEPGLLVPWIAYSPSASVSAAAPIGLRGEPDGMT